MLKQHTKITKSIKLQRELVAIFHFEKQDEKVILPYIDKFIKHYKNLKIFFGVQPPKIDIHFVYTRKEMDECCGWKTAKWVCGSVSNKDIYQIYIFSPKVFEKLTTHKKGEILPTIVHETAHTFVSQINKKCFAWIVEGICQYLEPNNKTNNKIEKKDWQWFKKNNVLIDSDIDWDIVAEHGGYKIGYNLAKYIIKTYNRKTVLELLKVRRAGDKKNLKQKIEKILKQDLDSFVETFEKMIELI